MVEASVALRTQSILFNCGHFVFLDGRKESGVQNWLGSAEWKCATKIWPTKNRDPQESIRIHRNSFSNKTGPA